MAAGVLVPLEEYLSTVYKPDLDYDNGVLIERNAGKRKHSRMEALLSAYICNNEKPWGIRACVEQRIQIAPGTFCVADICASLANAPTEDILVTPPLFTIEILSPDDKFADVERKAQKYLAMGINYVWTLDPETGHCWRHDPANWMVPIPDSILRVEGTSIEIPVAELVREI